MLGKPPMERLLGYNESVDEEGSITYKPILQYEIAGRGYVFNSPNASSPPAYDIGEEVELLYNPAEPGNARINNFWELWLVPILLAPLGGILAFLTIAWILVSIWRRLRGIKATPITLSLLLTITIYLCQAGQPVDAASMFGIAGLVGFCKSKLMTFSFPQMVYTYLASHKSQTERHAQRLVREG